MITLEKLKIYSKYSGDGDAWIRLGKGGIDSVITSDDWRLIDDLLQDLTIIKNGYAPLSLAISVDKRITETFDNEHTIEFLKSMVK